MLEGSIGFKNLFDLQKVNLQRFIIVTLIANFEGFQQLPTLNTANFK